LLPQEPGDAIGALRWNVVKLTPGQTAAVSARVRVDEVTPARNRLRPKTTKAVKNESDFQYQSIQKNNFEGKVYVCFT